MNLYIQIDSDGIHTAWEQSTCLGWYQLLTDGRWRALTTGGALTHHNSSLEALECLKSH
jgi:hypothetical protein